jgi:hypothetical protein
VVLAYLFFATFLAHFGAALFHGPIRRDGVLESMASWRQAIFVPGLPSSLPFLILLKLITQGQRLQFLREPAFRLFAV